MTLRTIGNMVFIGSTLAFTGWVVIYPGSVPEIVLSGVAVLGAIVLAMTFRRSGRKRPQ